jgi:hypothetical protein
MKKDYLINHFGLKFFLLILIIGSGIKAQANEVAVFTGNGTLSDHNLLTQPSVLNCAADLSLSPTGPDLTFYEFQLFIGDRKSSYSLKKAEKVFGLPLYDYSSRFQTVDGRIGEIQVTEKDHGKRLEIWGRIQRSEQDLFAQSETFFVCKLSRVGIEK